MTARIYFGRVCAKHPELDGKRYACNGGCLGCSREHRLQRYYSATADENARSRAWRKENREYQAARCRQWHAENTEHHRLRERTYYETNREAVLAQRRAKRRHDASRDQG